MSLACGAAAEQGMHFTCLTRTRGRVPNTMVYVISILIITVAFYTALIPVACCKIPTAEGLLGNYRQEQLSTTIG